jgi:predicted NAD-dependent protein-ADP-ribosyltransferase YbiA (DUF1768 family)
LSFLDLFSEGYISRGRTSLPVEEKAMFLVCEGVAKTTDLCRTAAQAKTLGKEISRSGNWDRLEISPIRELLRLKRKQVPIFRRDLLASSGKPLEHFVPDTFWGRGSTRRQGKKILGDCSSLS